jgi:hypothetical protein
MRNYRNEPASIQDKTTAELAAEHRNLIEYARDLHALDANESARSVEKRALYIAEIITARKQG